MGHVEVAWLVAVLECLGELLLELGGGSGRSQKPGDGGARVELVSCAVGVGLPRLASMANVCCHCSDVDFC